jgi:ABC-type uncharacterized transport system permease subunit
MRLTHIGRAKAQSSPTTQKISTYLVMIVLVVMALSVAALLLAVTAYYSGDQLAAGVLAVIGFLAFTLSGFMLYQSRRQTVQMKIDIPKVMTTIECTNKSCNNKTTREFIRGDYVFKETGDVCQKCSGKQMITAIYKEVKEKEKNYNF